MTIQTIITLKKGKEFSIQRFHPWIFSGAIQKTEGPSEDGCWVEVQDFKKNILGYGHFQNGSISVRMLSFEKTEPSHNFWDHKIALALQLREISGLPSSATNSFRLIHGEGDGLPGLIVDFYDGIAVIQAHSVGMHVDRLAIAEGLKNVLGEKLRKEY